jgi:mRNA interferase HigB
MNQGICPGALDAARRFYIHRALPWYNYRYHDKHFPTHNEVWPRSPIRYHVIMAFFGYLIMRAQAAQRDVTLQRSRRRHRPRGFLFPERCNLFHQQKILPGRTLCRSTASAQGALDAWFGEVRKARWSNTADVKRLYAYASIVSIDRIVFNIRGNAYRLVVAVDFEKGIVWIKWLGTHRDYDRIDVREVNLE